MTTRNGYALTWTVDNLPESIASAQGNSTFSYGPEDQRYAQSATFNGSTTATAYIGGLFEVVSTATDTEYRHNIIADGQIVAVHTIDQSGSAYTDYLHYDHLGSVDAITNDSGSVIQTMSFDAFGVRRDANNWNYDLSQNQIATLKNYTDRGYTDQEQLDNLSLVDLNGRIYDPTVGRMISADPTVPDALYSQAFNRFAYVYDSPLVYVDPSGYATAEDCPKANATGLKKIVVSCPGGGSVGGGGGASPSGSPGPNPNPQPNPKNPHNNPNNNPKQPKQPQPEGSCPRAQHGATPPPSAHDSSSSITNVDNNKSPPNSVVVTAPDGTRFLAPDYANFQAAYIAGENDGALSVSSPIATGLALNADFGHWGQFDFQRNGSTFISAYANASNYAVGIGLNGAGDSLSQAINTVDQFAELMSSNDNTQRDFFVTQGWDAAQSGACK